MKSLYTQKDYLSSKSIDKLPCMCYTCGNTFYTLKKLITREIKIQKGEIKYCSLQCRPQSEYKKKLITCTNCNLEFEKTLKQINKSKNHFCSKSCSATYNNKHKTHGTRRSKLEVWLESKLNFLYPNFDIKFNSKDTIGSELDIYIPSLNLAFELNGIFHYEPIYGVDKLLRIQGNDISKSKACHEAMIDLCIIDTSGQSYFKPSTSQKYLDIINNIIKERVLTS